MKPLTSSVIICTKDRPKDLIRCLTSLATQTHQPEEIIIVDASTEPAPLPRSLQSLPIRKIKSQPGLTKQRNIGIKAAKGATIFFFDDDTVLDKNYLKACLTVYAGHPKCGGVTGKIMEDHMPALWQQVINYCMQLAYFSPAGKLRLSGNQTDPRYGQTLKSGLEFMSGCCMSFRKDVLETIGGFDEKLTTYCFMEDLDASYRASKISTLYFTPEARIEHLESPQNRLKRKQLAEMTVANKIYLAYKNLPMTILQRLALYWSIVCLMLFAAVKGDWLQLHGYMIGLKRS